MSRPSRRSRVTCGFFDRLEDRRLLSAAEFDLGSLMPANGGDGSQGFAVTGITQSGYLGRFPAGSQSLGDINQDGRADVLVSAFASSTSDPTAAGHVYILLGQPGGFPVQPDLQSLDGVTGYSIEGIAGQRVIGSVVGDLNHDGAPDVALTIPGARSSTGLLLDGGQTYVLFGGAGHLASLDGADGVQDGHISLANVGGADGFLINGTPTDATFSGTAGASVITWVTSAGDVNGDHVDDILIGSYHAPADPGRAYVIFGRDSTAGAAFPPSIDLGTLNGSNGFLIPGLTSTVDLGSSVAGIGDVNGDGVGDIAIGAMFSTSPGGYEAGQVYVILGRSSFPASFNLGSLNGLNGFVVNGGAAYDYLGGWSGGAAGDFNGDGVSDLLMQAFGADAVNGGATGASYILFGKKTAVAGAFASAISVTSLNGSNGVVFQGTSTYSAFAGDVNHDGYSDVITANYMADPNGITDAGQAFVIYGGPSFGPTFDVTNLTAAKGGDGSAGFVINGYIAGGYAGFGIGGAGDLNGDGYVDILIGASYADVNGLTDNGQAYVVYGKPSPAKTTKFYVVGDASPDRTFEYNPTGSSVENYALNSGDTAPRGSASTIAGDKVWVVDANKNVYVYSNSGALLGSWSAGGLASNATVEGITVYGTDVWIVDSKQDKVFRYAGAATRLSGTQTAASSFSLNSANNGPKDVVTDGTSLWVVNDGALTDKVFKYSLSGSLQGSWTISGAGSSPTGITLDPAGGGTLWTVDSGTNPVYQFNNARSLTSGSLSPSSSFPLAAGNTNPQGIADPPTPSTALSVSIPRTVGLGNLLSSPAATVSVPGAEGARGVISWTPTTDQDLTALAVDVLGRRARRTR